MTKQKQLELAEYLAEEGRMEALMGLEIGEVCSKINADGFSITQEELEEFNTITGEIMSDNEELNEEELENVAGGVQIRNGGCGSRCPLCGKINGIVGHNCKSKWAVALKPTKKFDPFGIGKILSTLKT